MDATHQHHHGVLAASSAVVVGHSQGVFDMAVVAADAPEDDDDHGDQRGGDPGADEELRLHDHDEYGEGREGAGSVDELGSLPAGFPEPAVMDHHADLGQGEAGEHAHGVQRDEQVG